MARLPAHASCTQICENFINVNVTHNVSRSDCWWWVGEVVGELTGGPRAQPETFLWGRATQPLARREA
jgi:hypothetical protein